MGFCKPGDPCWGALEGTLFGPVNLATILSHQKIGLDKAIDCGLDVDLDFCKEIRACITGNTHTNLTACTMYVDVIHPCTTGTTFTGDVRASARVGIGTSTTPNEKLTVVGAVSATSQLYFSEIVGGTF